MSNLVREIQSKASWLGANAVFELRFKVWTILTLTKNFYFELTYLFRLISLKKLYSFTDQTQSDSNPISHRHSNPALFISH